jgi:YVTN family beta-propeller protein
MDRRTRRKIMLSPSAWIFSSIIVASAWGGSAAYAAEALPRAGWQPLSDLPITARIKVPPGPAWLETGFGSLWVTQINSTEVLRIDPDTNKVIATIRVGSKPELGTGMGLGYVRIADTKDKSIERIDPNTNQVAATVNVGVRGEGTGLSIGENYVWISAEGIPLSQIDPRTNRLGRQFAGGKRDDPLRVGFGSAWIVDEPHGEIWRVDLARLEELPSL